jgi:mannitol/fructose-specific phosphotransferase system IIA component (Ntr-type)
LDWLGEGGEPVRLVFLFVVPEHDISTYLSVLAGMAKLSQAPAHMHSLFQAPTAEQMLDVLREISIPPRQPATV